MNDDVNAILKEIAQLLRQQVEQSAAASKLGQRFARLSKRSARMPDFAAIEAKHEAQASERRDEAARLRAEDVVFRERLLHAIEDQNDLIRTLLDRVSSPTTPRHTE